MSNSNNIFLVAAVAAAILGALFIFFGPSRVARVEATALGKIISPDERKVTVATRKAIDTSLVDIPAAATLQPVPLDPEKFQESIEVFKAEWAVLKQEILEKEEDYIFIGEMPRKALKNVTRSRKLLNETKAWVDQVQKEMDEQITELDRQVQEIDQYCETVPAGEMEKKCSGLSDSIHHYETRISVYMGMMEVMERRYLKAEEVLKQ